MDAKAKKHLMRKRKKYDEPLQITEMYTHLWHHKMLEGYIKHSAFIALKHERGIANIYRAELALFLFAQKVKVWNSHYSRDEVIDGQEYIPDFVDGFIEGVEYFKSEFGRTGLISNKKDWVATIRYHYYEIPIDFFEGWVFVKKATPIVVSPKEIKKYGYYSGLVSVVDELVLKHPRMFKNFHNA